METLDPTFLGSSPEEAKDLCFHTRGPLIEGTLLPLYTPLFDKINICHEAQVLASRLKSLLCMHLQNHSPFLLNIQISCIDYLHVPLTI